MSRYRRINIGDDWVLIEKAVNLFGKVLWWKWIDTINIYKEPIYDADDNLVFSGLNEDVEDTIHPRSIIDKIDDLEGWLRSTSNVVDLQCTLQVFEKFEMFEECALVKKVIQDIKK